MPDPTPGLTAIVTEALALADPAARAAYLDRTCGGDAALRRRAEGLIAVHLGAGPTLAPDPPGPTDVTATHDPAATAHHADEATGTFAPPDPNATGVADESVPTLRAARGPNPGISGTVIAGRYALVELLGEGGMGVVYRANQTTPVRRPVAVKLIKAGMDSRAVLARFDAERQALALMDHPHIARVFDGGTTPTGQPFFVMELVDGVPLTEYCDRKRLAIKARLELFVLVCEAVQHAHQKGVIHRDLKPGNVLVTEVDGRPAPKVIDFGVAKATEQKLTDLSFVDTGLIVGTPAYMSPEQADPSSADIDTRTDVYALGVILYELLVGSPPLDARQFKRAAVLEMLRMVREVDPPRPSTKLSTAEDGPNIAANRGIEPARLATALRGELDWVVMKAIEKDRGRRYETASAFARDLRRYLADEVVEARPPSRGYRLRKFVRRHKGQVIVGAVIALALVGGLIGTTLGMVEARRQKDSAEQGWAKAEAEHRRAEENFATARGLILDLGRRINQIETGQMNTLDAEQVRTQALDKVREQFERFRADRPDDEAIQHQAASLHRYVANLTRLRTYYPAARSAYALAEQIYEELLVRYPDQPTYRDELALTLADRASLEMRIGQLKDAAATLDRAMTLAQGMESILHASAYNRTLGMIVDNRTDVAYRLGLFDEAAQLARRAGALFATLKTAPTAERVPTDPLFAAMAVHRLALAQRELGQVTEAIAAHADALARMKALAGPQANRDVRYWDGEVRRELARTAAAIPERRAVAAADLIEVIRGAEKLVEENPNIPLYSVALAASHLRRGELLLLLGQPDPAADELTKSLAVSRVLIDRHGALTTPLLIRGQTFLALGRARSAAGKSADATAQWKNALRVFEAALRIDPDNVHHHRGHDEAERALRPPAK